MSRVVAEGNSCALCIATTCGISTELYGQRVRLLLNSNDPEGSVTGTLIHVPDCGEATVDTAEGRRLAWPVLDCVPIDPGTEV